ncbi:MAG: hypothetical protein Q7U20_01410 [Caulobacter sp.]|nr:hypothetical protein [Caulobacter sp.]
MEDKEIIRVTLLAWHDAARRMVAHEAVLSAYGVAVPKAGLAATPPFTTPARTAEAPVRAPAGQVEQGDRRSIKNFTEYGREVIATAMDCLIGQTAPVKTRELVDAIGRRGVEIRGENPINALGALLKRSADITSHGKRGWTLTDQDSAQDIARMYARKENEPPSVPAGGSDAAGEGVSPPDPAQVQSNWGTDA